MRNYFKFGPVVHEMSFNFFFFISSIGHFVLRSLNYLCNFVRWLYGEHSCEVIFNLNHWFRRRFGLKNFYF